MRTWGKTLERSFLGLYPGLNIVPSPGRDVLRQLDRFGEVPAAHFAPECGRGKRDYIRDEFLLTDEGLGNLSRSVLHSESPLRFVETLCLMRSSWIHSRFRLFRDKESRIRVSLFYYGTTSSPPIGFLLPPGQFDNSDHAFEA